MVAIPLVCFLFHIPIASWQYILSLVLSAGFIFLLNSTTKNPLSLNGLLTCLGSCLLLTILFMAIASIFYDISWDGPEYHQGAIIELKNGWNPIYQPFSGIRKSIYDLFIFNYAKSSWIAQAVMYACVGNIQFAKSLHLMMMFSVAALAVSFMLSFEKIRIRFILLIAFVLAFNPITITQFFTFYLDALLSSCLICMFILLINYYREERKLLYLPGIFFAVHLASTLKFTGIVYAIMFSFFFILAYVIAGKIRKAVQLGVVFGLMHLSILCSTGYNPYVTNLIEFHHPFYPLNKIKFPTNAQLPVGFVEQNRVTNFFVSLFSRTQNAQAPQKATLKIPFTYSVSEISLHPVADARLGGFGVWFSGVFLLSLYLLYDIIRHEKLSYQSPYFWFLYLHISILMTVFIAPHPWWARYVPQFYLFPFIILIYSFLYRDAKPARIVRYMLLAAMVVNSYLTFEGTLRKNIPINRMIRAQLKELKAENKKVYLSTNELSNVTRLTDQGIETKIVKDEELTCKEILYLKVLEKHQAGRYCLQEK